MPAPKCGDAALPTLCALYAGRWAAASAAPQPRALVAQPELNRAEQLGLSRAVLEHMYLPLVSIGSRSNQIQLLNLKLGDCFYQARREVLRVWYCIYHLNSRSASHIAPRAAPVIHLLTETQNTKEVSEMSQPRSSLSSSSHGAQDPKVSNQYTFAATLLIVCVQPSIDFQTPSEWGRRCSLSGTNDNDLSIPRFS